MLAGQLRPAHLQGQVLLLSSIQAGTSLALGSDWPHSILQRDAWISCIRVTILIQAMLDRLMWARW